MNIPLSLLQSLNLLVFQEDKAYIKQCLENGEVDYMEVASEAAETEFFKYINSRGLLQQLSGTYPLKRKKEEVPTVKKEDLTPEQLKRCSYKRCYKWVSLIHTNRNSDFFFFVAMHLGSGKDHECPILYNLVENFLQIVGHGIMKWLLVDRGFLSGEGIGHLKQEWDVDTLTGLRSNMAVREDARVFIPQETGLPFFSMAMKNRLFADIGH